VADFETPASLEDLLNTGFEGVDQGGEMPAESLSFPADQQLDHAYLSENDLEAFDIAPEFRVLPCFTGHEAFSQVLNTGFLSLDVAVWTPERA